MGRTVYSKLITILCVAHLLFNHVPAWMWHHGTLRFFANEGFEAAHKRTKQLFAKGDRGGGKYGSLARVVWNVFIKLFRVQKLKKERAGSGLPAKAQEFFKDLKARASKRALAVCKRSRYLQGKIEKSQKAKYFSKLNKKEKAEWLEAAKVMMVGK